MSQRHVLQFAPAPPGHALTWAVGVVAAIALAALWTGGGAVDALGTLLGTLPLLGPWFLAALGLGLALAAGVQLTEDAGERLSTERVRAGVLDQQKGALEVDLSDRDRALAISEEALAASQDRADGLAARMEGLQEQLDAVLEEREEARAAARAALRAIRRR